MDYFNEILRMAGNLSRFIPVLYVFCIIAVNGCLAGKKEKKIFHNFYGRRKKKEKCCFVNICSTGFLTRIKFPLISFFGNLFFVE
jgi:hypothetical protein